MIDEGLTILHAEKNSSVQLWSHCTIVTMQQIGDESGYGLIPDAAMVVQSGIVKWVGLRADLPAYWLAHGLLETIDAKGALITPGLIDCHTHLVYGGNRANEFERRLQGETYESIARSGGGIASTVAATRSANAAQLFEQSTPRLLALINEGVTTIEIKSGYGLSLEHERKTLQVARRLGESFPVTVRTTFLGAHALPPEFNGRSDAYIDAVIAMLPVLHQEGLVDAVDAFCESIAFSRAQIQRVFEAARALGLPIKVHAEQLSDSDGATLAAQYGALSCDHLEWLSEQGAKAMAASRSVAVLLPGAFYFLRETKVPPIVLLREHKIPIALSTDCNPGSSPCTSILLMLNMACTLFRMTPLEALAGVTCNAASALGFVDRGVLAAGMRADFILWAIEHPAQLSYAIGANPRIASVRGGQSI